CDVPNEEPPSWPSNATTRASTTASPPCGTPSWTACRPTWSPTPSWPTPSPSRSTTCSPPASTPTVRRRPRRTRAWPILPPSGPPGSRPNGDFHHMFTHFVNQVTLYWRDKRISDVIRERAYDPSFGAVAVVRRAGLDLRNNLKWTSYGHLNVLRVEVMQLLDE